MFRSLFSRNRATTPGSLTQKVARGGIWNTIGTVGERGLGLVRTTVLARLLLPADFGLLGFALTLISGLHSLTTTGIQPALIQRRDVSAPVLNTAWLLSILRGFFLCTVLVASAPLAANFFNEPMVTPIIRILALNQIFAGFRNIGFVLLEKELDFRRRAYFDLLAALLTTAVSIGAALLWRNVWALVIGEASGSIIRFILSYHVHPYRPRLNWDFRIARGLFNYGKHILAFRIVDYLQISGDDLLVGKFLGPAALGFYTLAYQIANIPATTISRSVTGVTFPAYAKLQDEPDLLCTAYLRTIRLVAFLSIPAGLVLLVFAPQLTQTVFGSRWLPMVPALKLLCIFGVFRSLGYTTSPVFQAVGQPNILRNIGLCQFLWFAVAIYPCLIYSGIVGVAFVVTSGILLFDLLALWHLSRLIGLRPFALLKSLLGPGLAAGLAAGLGYGLGQIADLNSILRLTAALVACGFFYIFWIWIVDRSQIQEVRTLLQQVFKADRSVP